MEATTTITPTTNYVISYERQIDWTTLKTTYSTNTSPNLHEAIQTLQQRYTEIYITNIRTEHHNQNQATIYSPTIPSNKQQIASKTKSNQSTSQDDDIVIHQEDIDPREFNAPSTQSVVRNTQTSSTTNTQSQTRIYTEPERVKW